MRVVKGLLDFLYGHAQYLSFTLITILVLFYCIDPRRFAVHYSFIPTKDIYNELEKFYPSRENSCAIHLQPSQLLYPEEHRRENSIAISRKLGISRGGQWKPLNCHPLFSIAIIVPYRNRKSQLSIFTSYMHPFLQSQNLDYRIFVIEQSPMREFNRAKLFNVGYAEATRVKDFPCFIFHDIDLIPQNLANVYACTKMPRHMSSSINTHRYNLLYKEFFGGVNALTKSQFERVNGFSNVFYGWGGEDDDFYRRLKNRGFMITRFGPDIARYYMLRHRQESPSTTRFLNLEDGIRRFDTDGLSNLKYRVLDRELRPLYSWILVDI